MRLSGLMNEPDKQQQQYKLSELQSSTAALFLDGALIAGFSHNVRHIFMFLKLEYIKMKAGSV